MSEPTARGIWLRIFGTLIPLAIVALIALGSLKSDVQHLLATVETKAPREVVEAQYQALLRELQAIRADIQELKRHP